MNKDELLSQVTSIRYKLKVVNGELDNLMKQLIDE